MTVELLSWDPYEVLMRAIRVSHASDEWRDTYLNELGPNDRLLLEKIINMRHDSVLEHLDYKFYVEGVSRALLIELERHRFVRLTVESTRYTLGKRLAKTEQLLDLIVFPEGADPEFYRAILPALESLKNYIAKNDVRKYLIPEAFKTRFVMSVNARELDHIFDLRCRKGVLPEFRRLTEELFKKVVNVHEFLWRKLAERGEYCEGVGI